MYKAAQEGNFELLKYHIENGIDPNYQHPEILSTPLVAAIAAGHDEIALFLLDHGAKPDLVSEFDGLNPFQAAEKYKRTAILEILKSRFPALSKKPFWKIF